MKKTNISELNITSGMYERALEVEQAWNELKQAEDTMIDIKKNLRSLSNRWVELDNAFQNEVNSDFDTFEIVREYERREGEHV